MGLLSKLFGSKKSPGSGSVTPPQTPALATFHFSDRFVRISQHDMFGEFSRSPNGRYMLVWQDAHLQAINGKTHTIKGRYMLFDRDRVLCDAHMERPNDGKVSDSGAFILNDWRSFGGELQGTFYAFRSDGSEILRQNYCANLYNNGLSRDGHWAACQTCNAPSERDGSILTIFNLDRGKEHARWSAESGWPDGYEFAENENKIFLVSRDLGKFAYSLDGEFLDRQTWQDAGIANGNVYIIANALQQMGDTPLPNVLTRMITGLDIALKKPHNSDTYSQAHILRLKGECHDKLSDWKSALECYEAALALNDKVGAKRRVSQIRKAVKDLNT